MNSLRIFVWALLLAVLLIIGRTAFAEEPRLAQKDLVMTRFFQQTNGWSAGDVAASVPLSDGRILWLFGDSYVNQFDPASGTLPCLFNAHNAVLVQNTNLPSRPQTLANFNDNDKSFFRVPDAAPGEFRPYFWPNAGFQAGNTIFVFLVEIQKTPEGGMWGFKPIGQYLAKMTFPELQVTGFVKLPALNGIFFGSGFVKDDQGGFVYAYGNKQNSIASDVFVARFPVNNTETEWTFWDGSKWNTNVTNAVVVAHGASTSVNVCQVKNKFLLVTSEFSVACDQGSAIYVSTSDRPTGPFSERRNIFNVEDRVNGHRPFFYSAVPHPELVDEKDELLITYCINGYEPCVPTCVDGRMNPNYYRPRAIRFSLPVGLFADGTQQKLSAP